jgi:hypothetical protein
VRRFRRPIPRRSLDPRTITLVPDQVPGPARNSFSFKQRNIRTSNYNVEQIFAWVGRMVLLIEAVLLIASCAKYKASTIPDYEGESLFQRTGQASTLPGWRKTM